MLWKTTKSSETLLWKSSKLIRHTALEIYKSPQRNCFGNLPTSSETLLWKSIELIRDTALEIHRTHQRHCSGSHANNYNLKALETLNKDSFASLIYLFLEDSDFHPPCLMIKRSWISMAATKLAPPPPPPPPTSCYASRILRDLGQYF